MHLRTLTGDDEINGVLMLAMSATVEKLKAHNLITKEQAADFLDEHICLCVAGSGPFKSWFERLWWTDATDSQVRVAIARVPVPPQKKSQPKGKGPP